MPTPAVVTAQVLASLDPSLYPSTTALLKTGSRVCDNLLGHVFVAFPLGPGQSWCQHAVEGSLSWTVLFWGDI